jgi:hypothetical protein
LLHEDVEVRSVPVNRFVNEAPAIRTMGDTVIVPVVEEELVITKRLVLKEELHLKKRRTKERIVRQVELERERTEVRRLDANGRIIDRRSVPPEDGRRSRPRSVLDKPLGRADRNCVVVALDRACVGEAGFRNFPNHRLRVRALCS